ncbi:unnamed protein product [Pieris macdunnoughi]|uniref:Oxysterol-binding protein n=1 Tax=Pieris macdunnoughi TaxID=345717 RepID=A0A821SS02_9NEOP|nr:unnamed protein product [Pieris macdunnoughi]
MSQLYLYVSALRWFVGNCNNKMSNPTGVKHVATEPTRLESKRERRRGAAGRAAALRRAPSDSDCSGETASLSADSGERSVRPLPPPPRTGKSRGRRRGSEWEVLEGLKDGQRFDKRPEVFNGYLHKKRKWPLKGWHKRFFVVDGGILVYARSPSDVARGRLHGSVDVGLSVISAKARRRRIDIDADEFIYHLRAKTPEVFRTWLNVLKTHRLYRQHLLTFGARESVPKIHAPIDDLPPTDTSSRMTPSSIEKSSICTSSRNSPFLTTVFPVSIPSPIFKTKVIPIPKSYQTNNIKKIGDKQHKSLCSMNCVAKCKEYGKSVSPSETDGEKLECSDFNPTSLRLQSSLLCKYSLNSPTKIPFDRPYNFLKQNSEEDSSRTPAFFFFKPKEKCIESPMRKSNKSTNLVKYKNMYEEPKLKKRLNKCILLANLHSRDTNNTKLTKNVEVQIDVDKQSKSFQDAMTAYEYDFITERLMTSVIETVQNSHMFNIYDDSIKSYIGQIVKELYTMKLAPTDVHPIKILFRCLLEFWLKNTTIGSIRDEIMQVKSIDRQSNKYFTKDEKISSYQIESVTKETQFYGMKQREKAANIPNDDEHKKSKKPKELTKFSHNDKERQIQKLERILKNTVYICETVRNSRSKEKDIKITKRLIDNIDKLSHKSEINKPNVSPQCDDSNSSNELTKIQDTISHLISETAIPATVAKEFLSVYLDLLHSSHSITDTCSSQDDSKVVSPICDVETESVQKKVSRCVTTGEFLVDNINEKNNLDSGQMYLKDVLDKITTIFTKENNEQTYNDLNVLKNEQSPEIPVSEGNKRPMFIGNEVRNLEEDKNRNETLIDPWLPVNYNSTSDSDKFFRGQLGTIDIPLIENISFSKVPIDLKPYSSSCGSKDRKNIIYDSDPYSSGGTSKAYREREKIEILPGSDIAKIPDSPESTNATEFDDSQSCYLLSLKGLAGTFKSKKKSPPTENLPTCTCSSLSYPEEMNVFEKQPRAIDEKFILLLLENLALLSKNVPSLYKDINNFYLKLKKKHEKAILNASKIQGLSLLGKIYNEDGVTKKFEDSETQYDISNISNFKETTTNTSVEFQREYRINNVAISAEHILNNNAELQTEEKEAVTLNPDLLKKLAAVFDISSTQTDLNQSSVEDILKTDKAVSNQNKHREACTKDCAMNTTVKYVLSPRNTSQNMRNLKPKSRSLKNKDISKINRRKWKVQQDFINEMVLGPSYKRSKAAQTETLRLWKDFNVYQLFLNQKLKPVKCVSSLHVSQESRNDLKTIYRCTSDPSYSSGLVSPTSGPLRGPQAGFVSGTPGGRLASWIIESGAPLDTVTRELGQAQLSVQQLQRLLDALELQQQTHHDTDVSMDGASPNVKKDRRKFGLRKKKSNSKCATVEPPHIDPSSSHMALSTLTAPPSPGGGASSVPNSAASLPIACAATRPQSLPGAEVLNAGPTSFTSLTPDHQLREDFTVLAKDLVTNLKSIVATLVCERGRLRAAMESAESPAPPSGVVAALRTNLSTALQQNSELRSRLSRIHDASDLAEISSMGANSDHNQFKHSVSYSSSCVSGSEFFDAEEYDNGEVKENNLINADETGVIELDGDSSSEAGSLSSEEGSASSDNSDAAMVATEQIGPTENGGEQWSRRRVLPAPRPNPGGPSLWNLLYKNIGKDLSQISMPVTINEPLNMLQRLCEELEYSELLDSASTCEDPVNRMALVAAFAVSSYAASAHRAASKPFNPLLGETYECVREDKGFKFLAEQVSHHPPISACHAVSSRWVFWQEARIKTKFWGKSMEFQPAGRVHLILLPTGDHYTWNKVTTCVHNLFGGQRWVDQYGDMLITCQGSDISCKLNFVKASSWSSTRHEVRGAVYSKQTSRLRLHGRWSEALYAGEPPAARCLWRPGAMPPDYELYYGFTRFAMELNEMEPGLKDILPHTDTRFRPDQRALEEGDVDAAEQFKHELEQSQRERRRDRPDHVPAWFRKATEGGEETWVYGGEYWRAQADGYMHLHTPRLW